MKKLILTVMAIGATFVLTGPASAALTCAGVKGCKLCSVVSPANFRDSFTVPGTWTAETCRQYALDVLTPKYEMGCIFKDDFSLGGVNDTSDTSPTLPNPNCGWQ